jgi:hypothetical protein
MERTIEQRTIAKVSWRLLPLMVVIYFIGYMDRTNVGRPPSAWPLTERQRAELRRLMISWGLISDATPQRRAG